MAFSITGSILDFLANQTEPVRKSAIVQATGYASGSIQNALPKLTSNKYVAESRGYYVITPAGRKELDLDPFFTHRANKQHNGNSIIIEIPISELSNVSKRAIDQLTFDQIGQYKGALQTLAIMFAVAAKIPLPNINNIPPATEDEDILIKKIAEFVQGV